MSRVRITPHGRRLFVADGVSGRVYVLASTTVAARLLEPTAVAASNAQVGDFLRDVADVPTSELASRFRVSRQTIHHWRRRAAIKSPPPSSRVDTVAILDQLRAGASVLSVSRSSGWSESTIRRVARTARVRPAPVNPYPTAEELVELARGKTWTDLAAALGRCLKTVRAWIYARPNLARSVRAVMVRRAPERRAHEC